jgi:hypothetical protein
MNDIRKSTDCSNCCEKGVCKERVIEIHMWKETGPCKPIASITKEEEQEILDICKGCNKFSKKQL